ncbi:isoprenylcysteine carboxylmethyltransferase family protein [Kribbella speibonae]|uniref:Isoprenylcysteine carboxylmethyltransferase family protein n=1 Tax=Kribbella speibonae TaxID=1572660 RepID=A0A4R0JDS1_9ACTN|nr:isoprenylcysteine carboxylmethyltransferase family protein [Kribbella speibonae]
MHTDTRLKNIPIPEASLAGIAAGFALEQVRRWRVGSRPAGWSLVAAGSVVIASSLRAARTTDLTSPERLVTSGPYALSRNPMYVGWSLIHLGIGLAAGSGWVVGTVPLAGVLIHRDVLGEERRLEEKFEDAYRYYRDTVRRYL